MSSIELEIGWIYSHVGREIHREYPKNHVYATLYRASESILNSIRLQIPNPDHTVQADCDRAPKRNLEALEWGVGIPHLGVSGIHEAR